jgi:hypothetical protein
MMGDTAITHWFMCACHSHALQLERDEDGDYQLAIWQYGQESRSWRHRLRLIWATLRGRYYADQMLLHANDANQLARELLNARADWYIGPSPVNTTAGDNVTVTYRTVLSDHT